MQDLNDSLKHLRGIHLVFVMAAVAIAMALSSSDSIHERALEQLGDVVRLSDALTAQYIADSISETAEASKAETKLEDFVEESILEYAEAMDGYFESCEIRDFLVDLEEEDVHGHVSDFGRYERYEYRSQDEMYWFGRQLCLLGDGTKVYSHPDDLALLRVTDDTTLGACSSFLDRLLQVDRLYVEPTFHPSYFFEGPVAERYEGFPDGVLDRMSEMEDIRLSVDLTAVGLTESSSRATFKNSQGHAEEDPIAYSDYDFEFDTLTLEVDARPPNPSRGSDQPQSESFDLELPIMFREREPKFMSDALQQTPLDKAYYARYLSGARSFERLFPELAETSTHLRSVTAEDFSQYLEEQARSSHATVSLLGLQIRRDLIEVWGVLLMLGVQLYFCMHYRALIGRIPRDAELPFPWIGLYRDYVATIVFHISIALPFCVCLLVAFGPNSPTHFRLLEIAWLLLALGLLAWTEVVYVGYRRRLA